MILTRRQFLNGVGTMMMGAVLTPTPLSTSWSAARRANTVQSIHTVTGPVAPTELGTTLIHEHILCDFIGAEKTGPHRWERDEVFEVMLPYLKTLRAAGGGTFVDCSPKYVGRDPLLLKRLAEASGLRIITNTGLYKEPYLPRYALDGTPESLADDWTQEAEEGLDGTGIRPGFIKIAANEGPLNATQERIVRAAALTHLRTGLTIASHTTQGKTALQELEILAQENVDARVFVWVHADAEPDPGLRREAGWRGAWIELDSIDPSSPQRHIGLIEDLLHADLINQVLISQDAGWYSVGEPRGGSPRSYEKLLTGFVPALAESGIGRAVVQRLLKGNPGRALVLLRYALRRDKWERKWRLQWT